MHHKHFSVYSTDLNIKRYVRKLFEGRKLAIATMHGKEKVIAPMLEKFLPITTSICLDLDTDQFGTFSGDTQRVSPLHALRQKARLACKISSSEMTIASEGSFGSHPLYSFLNVNEEMIMLSDHNRGWEIFGHYITHETNVDSRAIKTWDDLHQFAIRAGFPSHGVILKSGGNDFYKDICCWDVLYKKFSVLVTYGKPIEALTDMRAMRNPTRMRSIKLATENLIQNIFSLCPDCMIPGFSVHQSMPGLPCKLCNSPTKISKGSLLMCRSCSYSTYQQDMSNSAADPAFCDRCNP